MIQTNVLARGACLAMLGEVYDDTGCLPAFQGGDSSFRRAGILSVTPNPVSHQVRVSWNPGDVSNRIILEVTDLNGRGIYRQENLDGASGMATLDVTNWPAGMLLVRILHDYGMDVQPIQITR